MADHPFALSDRVAVVTGGLGQLGRQFTRALHEAGARVASLDRRPENGVDTEWCMHLQADVTDRGSLERALVAIEQRLGVPEVLINGAAIDAPPDAEVAANGPFEGLPIDIVRHVLDVNVSGVIQCCQTFGGRMAAAGRGSIVNIASIYGLVSPDQRIYEYRRRRGQQYFKPAAYAASKAALLNLTRYLATYWAPRNVRVNTVSFGGVFNRQDDQFLQEYIKRVPMGRMAREDEYNGAVLFLASDASSYVTGANLVIDGGYTAW